MSDGPGDGDAENDAGEHERFLDAVATGDGYYFACSNGHGSLPPRLVCPRCGDRDLTERPLPEAGTVETYTVVSVATPSFVDETPYATAIADFGDVRLTGIVRGVEPDAVEVGMTVEPDVGEGDTTGRRPLVLRPA